MRLVGFVKSQRTKLLGFYQKRNPLNLRDCEISENHGKLEVVIKTHTILEPLDAQFTIPDPKTIGSPIVNLDQLSKLKQCDKATVRVTVSKVNEPQTVSTGKIKQLIVADATGRTTLTLWETEVNMLTVGKSYQPNIMEMHPYLGKYQLTLPQSGASIDEISNRRY